MAFWGIVVKPDQAYTFHGNQGATRRIRITQASLEILYSNFNATKLLHVVSCQVGDEQPIVLCSMFTASALTHPLDVEFEEAQTITFSATGFYAIHLLGYYKEPSPQYLSCTHLQHLLNFQVPANFDNDHKIDDGLEDLNLINSDTFQVTGMNKETPKIDLVLEDETINGEHNVSTEKLQTEKNEVIGLELLVKSRGRDDLVENDPSEIDVLTGDEDTNGSRNICASIYENEEFQPHNIEAETNSTIVEIANEQEFQPVIEHSENNIVGPAITGITEVAEIESKNMETHSINDIIDVISTNEVIPPAIIEFENNTSRVAITKSDETQPGNIEIGEVILAMTDSEECVPDSEDSWDNDLSANQYRTNMLKKQQIKESIATQFRNQNLGILECDSKVQGIETNMKDLHVHCYSPGGNHHKSKKNKSTKIHQYMHDESHNIVEVVNATTIASSCNYEGKSCWRSNLKDDHHFESVEVTDAKRHIFSGVINESNSDAPTKLSADGHEDGIKKLEFGNIENQSQKELLANDNNSLNLKLKKKNKRKQIQSEISQSGIVSCSNDEDCKSNRTLSTRMMQDQKPDSYVPSTLVDANVSVKLKRKKRKGDSKHYQ